MRPTQTAVSLLDGRIVPTMDVHVPWDAPGFRQGYGLFETIRVASGRAFLGGLHAQRITDAAPSMGIEPWLNARSLTRALDRLVRVSAIRDGAMRLYLMPGAPPPGEEMTEETPATRNDPSPGPDDAEQGRQARYAGATPARARYIGQIVPGRPRVPEAARAVLSPDLRDPAGPLVGLKTISYAAERLLLAQARLRGADEALRRNLAGRIAEGTRSNLFLIEENRLVTPPLSEGLLAGVTRWFLLGIAAENGLQPAEEPVAVERLQEADEAFLASTLRGVVPLVELGGRPIGSRRPGPKTVMLRAVLERHIARG